MVSQNLLKIKNKFCIFNLLYFIYIYALKDYSIKYVKVSNVPIMKKILMFQPHEIFKN